MSPEFSACLFSPGKEASWAQAHQDEARRPPGCCEAAVIKCSKWNYLDFERNIDSLSFVEFNKTWFQSKIRKIWGLFYKREKFRCYNSFSFWLNFLQTSLLLLKYWIIIFLLQQASNETIRKVSMRTSLFVLSPDDPSDVMLQTDSFSFRVNNLKAWSQNMMENKDWMDFVAEYLI